MKELLITYMPQLEQLFRILLAGFLGGAIGFERESKRKTAGIRTHVIVAVSSALMMLLSKYGFYDVLSAHVGLDPSRIASGAVTAIGFLGTGIIFSRNHKVSGLTTSAGVWATVGVGMSVGAGMYFIGGTATVLVVLVEVFLGRRGRLAEMVERLCPIEIEYTPTDSENDIGVIIKEELEQKYECEILKCQAKRKEDILHMNILVRTVHGNELIQLTKLMETYQEIIKISF